MERDMHGNKQELKKGPWKPEEDLLLTRYIEVHGEGKWATVSKRSGLMRGGKSCRLRWKNYLRPNLKRGEMSKEEEDLIIRMHKLLGNRWSLIAGRLPGRTDNEVKNYWNTHLSKKYSQGGQGDQTDKSNLKKRKLSHSPDSTTQPSCRKRSHIVSNGTEGINYVPNSINKLDIEGGDDMQIATIPDHSFVDEQSQLLTSNRKFYEDPFLPPLDSTFSLDPFGHGVKYWTDLPIYSPESIYQILL